VTRIEQAISAVRGQMRHMGIDPLVSDADCAIATLDDLGRCNVDSGLWFWSAPETEIKKFRRDWERWRKAQVKEADSQVRGK